jgi:uncharacterized protein
VDNFIRAAKALRGEPFENHKPPGYPFDDTDVYKVIEGASYTLSVHPDPQLEAYLDGLIIKIAAAQEPDGYLYTARTIDPLHPHPGPATRRWILEGSTATNCTTWVICTKPPWRTIRPPGSARCWISRSAPPICSMETFGPGKRAIWPGHQITEMGLAKLYRATGDERYLDLAKFMLDSRGPDSGERHAPATLRGSRQRKSSGSDRGRGGMPCAPCTCTRGWRMWPR